MTGNLGNALSGDFVVETIQECTHCKLIAHLG